MEQARPWKMTKIPCRTFCLIFFFPNICFHPLIKDEKRYFGEEWCGFHRISQIPKNPWEVIPEQPLLELSPLIFLSFPALQQHQRSPCHKFLFLLPPSTKFGVYYSHKNSFIWVFPSTEEQKCCYKIELSSRSSWWSFPDPEIQSQ